MVEERKKLKLNNLIPTKSETTIFRNNEQEILSWTKSRIENNYSNKYLEY